MCFLMFFVYVVFKFRFKCFLDAYKGCHQIQMNKGDEDKTNFITKEGLFCYTKMSELLTIN